MAVKPYFVVKSNIEYDRGTNYPIVQKWTSYLTMIFTEVNGYQPYNYTFDY